ncbi:N-methylhydantoinase B/acetone carboxylase, alpha subunit [Longilinea arvoryzae]|uniref:N-methylhydantoinase B/acetone carboxylase, alpha subunit n=1 Tax=Longilinea arvoryzae TaxID=360412 RepID=A0A0S7BI93_9CHLR|nr:hydantoinase B/oxoprolinase family protein [Longilinea arvoryzae]GAP13858.1 N-methylhydantoinase B/acetone carboxylase, alpha subunit [Longilinea arvoryzae]
MDAITLEVMRNRFFAITEEMGAAIIRTAYSTNIKDRRDCSCALFNVNGDTIAQAEHIPVHSGVLPWGVKGALSRIDMAQLKPGDVLMHNDPFIGGTHLPDIIMFSPIFFAGKLVAFVGNLAHHVDVGGMVPSSLTPDATEIFQEGIRFPPIKIRKAGVLDQELINIHRANVRTPYICGGDLMAQIAANNVGEQRFEELCREVGVDMVEEAIVELENYCDRRMVAELEKFPTGTYEFSDILEGDGATTEEPLVIKVKIITGGPQMTVDFTGTCPQVKGSINCVRPMTLACIYYVIRAVTDPSIPPNAGSFKRINVITPEGSLVNAVFPAATGSGNSITCQRLVDVLLGALAKAVPDKVCAAATGSMNGIQIGGFNPATNSYFVNGETVGGGYGGIIDQDGTSGVNTHMTNTRNTPVEVLETILPVKVLHYGLREDSEGAGLHRGGFGIERVFEFLTDDINCQIISDRVYSKPWGLAGGKEASGTRFTIERKDGQTIELSSKNRVKFNAHDKFYIRTSGGGGWGDPKKRDPMLVATDVKDGLISRERADQEYGVKLDGKGKVK